MAQGVGNVLLNVASVSRCHPNADGLNVPVFQELKLILHPAEVVALIGPSGSGKTTLLRLLNRLEDPDSGTIEFHGRPFAQYNPLELRRQIGLVPQKPFMFPGTVRTNLEYPFAVANLSFPATAELDHVLRLCAVDPLWLDQPARKLSVGQQQRVSMARTVLTRPKLMLLDEPTSSLDPETAELILSRLTREIQQSDRSVLIVTHDHHLAKKFASRILILRDGHLVNETKVRNDAEN